MPEVRGVLTARAFLLMSHARPFSVFIDRVIPTVVDARAGNLLARVIHHKLTDFDEAFFVLLHADAFLVRYHSLHVRVLNKIVNLERNRAMLGQQLIDFGKS